MKTEMIKVRLKIFGKEIEKEFEYSKPEDFEEALEIDGEKKAFKLYNDMRLIKFRDKHRLQMKADIEKKLKALTLDQLSAMGIEI